MTNSFRDALLADLIIAYRETVFDRDRVDIISLGTGIFLDGNPERRK
jgi:hypothetical protein